MLRTCEVCGRETEELSSVGFRWVCEDCLDEYCRQESLVRDLGEAYAEKQGADFIFRWWWEGSAYLTDREKLEIVAAAYRERREREPGETERAVRDYIGETFPEWVEFCRRAY